MSIISNVIQSVTVIYFLSSCVVYGDDWFTPEPFSGSSYHLFDMGVAKIDSDEYLDIFTSNHSDHQGIFLGGDSLNFSANTITQLGLNQDQDFPGLEGRRSDPNQVAPGLYIYWLKGQFTLLSTSNVSYSGRILFPSTVESINTTGTALATASTEPTEDGWIQSVIDFTIDSPSELVFVPAHTGIPLDIKLDPTTPLADVFVGWKRIEPTSPDFQTSLLDRHGYAWADIDGNGALDVLITRGGLHGDINNFPPTINDELLMQFSSGFVNTAAAKGIFKSNGRGRQVAWVDANTDGLLDLYIGNYGSDNLLFVQSLDGSFQEVAKNYGLNIWNTGAFVWLDADKDNDMDLLIKDVDSREIKYFKNQGAGVFEVEALVSNTNVSLVHWSIADFDRDGDADAFMASKSGSILFVNNGTSFDDTDPELLGIPAEAISAQFVDYDNDSRVDIHVTPDGLYKQHTNGKFYKSSHYVTSYAAATNRAWNLWFDADIDGKIDLMTAHRLPVRSDVDNKRYISRFYRNTGASENNWLQVDLIGPAGNANAIGARVELIQKDPSKVLMQFVGSSEGSHYSQGHYRLYFGLLKMKRVKGLRIYWPNGQVQVVPAIDVNQLVEIEYDPTSFVN